MADFILNPESEVVIFFGPRGRGKSSLMAHFIDEYLKTLAAQRWELSEQLLREENAQRKKPLSFPDRPPIYTNTKYKNLKMRNGKDFEPFPIKGKEIGVNDEDETEETYKYIFPASLIALDESYSEFPSLGEQLPKGQLKFFMECRHHHVIILLAAPRGVQINKNIRTSGSRFIEPYKVINEFDEFNRLYRTTWQCREFLESGAIEEYLATDGKSSSYIETTYIHNGNIRELYDAYAFKKDFYPKEGKNFET